MVRKGQKGSERGQNITQKNKNLETREERFLLISFIAVKSRQYLTLQWVYNPHFGLEVIASETSEHSPITINQIYTFLIL
jgi:hypothetical protein